MTSVRPSSGYTNIWLTCGKLVFPLFTLAKVWSNFQSNISDCHCRCYVATASPAKFQAVVQRAGLTFDLPEAVRALDNLATRYQNLERSLDWCKDWEERLREKILSLSSCRKNNGTYYSWQWQMFDIMLYLKVGFYFRNLESVYGKCIWVRSGESIAYPWSMHFLIWI